MIEIKERVLGKSICKALGRTDWGGKLLGKQKSFTKALMAVSTDDPVLESFRELGEVNIQSDQWSGGH